MRTLLVVVVMEHLLVHAGLRNLCEKLAYSAFIVRCTAHTLLRAILPGASWISVQRRDVLFGQPRLNRYGHGL